MFAFSVDKEKNKCQMKLTDQFIEQVVSKRFKRRILSRTSSLVRTNDFTAIMYFTLRI
jgi:hypothetical protein